MLTATQIEARKGKLTASRIAALMTGTAPAILRLYKEMIGEEQEEDLSDVWPVQLGIVTEQLNADWYERKTRTPLSRRGEVVIHPQYDWAAATIDAWDDVLGCPVECKHVGGREPLDPVLIDRYWPQIGWQMEVTGATQCALSIIMGANEPIVGFYERNAEYAAELIHRGAQFMECVQKRIVPVHLAPIPPPVDASKVYDMTDDATWQRNAQQWLQVKGAAETAKETEKVLKSIVPPDAKKASGHGIVITRDRASRLYLREIT